MVNSASSHGALECRFLPEKFRGVTDDACAVGLDEVRATNCVIKSEGAVG